VNGAITWLGANLQNVDPNRAQGVVQRFDRSGVAWSHAGAIDTADGAADELFGFALAVDGDTLVSGAFLEDPELGLDDAGTATVFERVGGAWQRVVRLIAPDALAEDQFGFAVAVRGDWIAVGAPQAIVNDQFNRGAVYLFERRAGVWEFAQKLTTASGLVDDAFGYSLAFDETGTRLVASVPGANFVVPDTGSALVFTRVGATWQLTQTVRPPRPVAGSLVGLRVALSSRVLALGAPDDSSLGDYTGRVHVYRWSGAQFDFAQTLETAERNSFEFFGNALAVDGVRLAIGAPGRIGDDFVADRGAVYLIDDARTSTSPLREILAPAPQGGAYFGLAVALRGERLVVGAPGESGPGGELEGAAYVFSATDGAVTSLQKLQPQAGRAFEFYGNPLALSAETLAIGGPARGVVNPREGSVYVYADDDPLFADGFE
jgi:hypothetical protein